MPFVINGEKVETPGEYASRKRFEEWNTAVADILRELRKQEVAVQRFRKALVETPGPLPAKDTARLNRKVSAQIDRLNELRVTILEVEK